MPNKILSAALMYAESGIPVFPCNRDKSPAIQGGFKSATTDLDPVRPLFANAVSIGVPMGEIVCLDIDAKHKEGLVADFEHACEVAGLTPLLTSLPKQLTPSGGGAHYLFRAASELPNMKLAVNENKETIIETRGKGGYIVVAPSPGYRFDRGGLLDVPQLTQEEQDALLGVARSFTEVAIKEKVGPQKLASFWETSSTTGDRPGDVFDRTGDLVGLLQKHGWTTSGGVYWTRPGKSSGISATLGKVEGKFYVFTSNAAPFEPETSYSPFACYAMLECGGDFTEASRRLAEEGYGESFHVETLTPEQNAVIDRIIRSHKAKMEMPWMKQETKEELAEKIEEATIGGAAVIEIEADKGDVFRKGMAGIFASDPENIDEMQKLAKEAVFVMPGIAIHGQVTIINGAPNTGKTLLTLKLLCELCYEHSLTVVHINADDTYIGGIEKMRVTMPLGLNTLIPGVKDFSEDKLALMLKSCVDSGCAGDFVFVLDTLKKFTSVMSKDAAREFTNMLRGFVRAGGTVICLAHTNKHKDSDGESVFEGVGDFDNDFDCAYTIERVSDKNADDKVVKFVNRKNRGPNEKEVSFTYCNRGKKSWKHRFESIRRIGEDEVKSVAEFSKMKNQFEEDREVVDYLVSQITELGPQPRTSLERNNSGLSGTGSKGERGRVIDRYSENNPVEVYRIFGCRAGIKGGRETYLLDNRNVTKGNLVQFQL